MRTFRSIRHHALLLGIGFLNLHTLAVPAQQTTPQGTNAYALLSQLTAAFSRGQLVQQVQLSGTATWYAGSQEDSGSVNLTASTDGSSQMQLSLDHTGQRTETETGVGSSAVCQWAGPDGVAHQADARNCWKPALWFLPAMSLQSSRLSTYLGLTDLGSGTVGNSPSIYRHLQGRLIFNSFSAAHTADIARESTTDFGLDPVSLLPSVLAYSVHPDNGAATTIAIEIHYSDYRLVDRVQIPFHIQRYVNGALQLDIVVRSAQVN